MRLKSFSFSSLCIFLTAPVFADSDTIETVVVTASGYEENIQLAPSSISVLSKEELEKLFFRDLTDALRKVPGVAVTGGGNRQDMSIRGLPAEYTVILIDGKKRSGRETQPGSSGGFEQDWLPPAEAIERIEVVRGPMSTLYGSDAMGGVINIVTRKNYGGWQGNVRAEALIQESAESGNHYQGQIRLSGPIIKNRLSASLTGLYQDREEDAILRGFGEKSLSNIHGTVNFQATSKDEITLELIEQSQARISTAGLSLPDNANSNETNNTRSAISLSHSGRYENFGGNSFVQSDEIENEGRQINLKTLTANTQWFGALGKHYLTLGSSFEQQKLQDFSTNLNPEVTNISNEQWSLFAENDWQFHSSASLTTGLRLDDNEQFATHLSPRVYLVMQASEQWTIKSGVATGYRAPDLRQVSPDWVQQSRGGNIFGNPELKPETTLSKELSFLYNGTGGSEFGLTIFQNDFTDKIALASCPENICLDADNPRYNINIDDAITEGAEISFRKKLSAKINMSVAHTYTFSEQQSGVDQGQPLTQIPKNIFRADVDFDITKNINAWLQVNYRSEESEPTSLSARQPIIAPSISIINLGSSFKLPAGFNFKISIQNITDETTTFEEFGYVEDGRHFWLAINKSF